MSALRDSSGLLAQLNENLATVTGLLADDPDKVGRAASMLNDVVADVQGFAAENRDALGTASDKLASVTTAMVDSLDDIKQTLHVLPTTLQNFINIYEPAGGTMTGAIAVNNFADPISFLCGAIQAASRLGAEQASKLCVQYLAPIVKNRQYNFPPLGENLIVGASARPNEVTYSEDWMRPDYVPPPVEAPAPNPPEPASLPAERRCAARDGRHQPIRRPFRPDGPPRRRLMTARRPHRVAVKLLIILTLAALPGCGWRGLNSLPLPGTEGTGPGSFIVQAQMPDVSNIQPNSRVQVGDVTVGNVTRIERQGWHALVSMQLNADVDLPANATAKLGQTSLLGSLHVELAPPPDAPPEGKLHDGSLIPLAHGGSYPTTEQTLAAMSMLLNGGGLGQVQDITGAFSTAFRGREHDLRSMIAQLDRFATLTNDQTGDIIAATDSLNNLAGQVRRQETDPRHGAAQTIPDALAELNSERDNLIEAADQLGKFSALTVESVNQTKENLVKELKDIGPVLESLANAGPSLTRALSLYTTYPFPNETLEKWMRGDYGNLSLIVDLTLSRIDAALLTGTRFEGNLTELELQWGRTIGQLPSPYTQSNPLIIPYRWDQGR